MTIFKWGVLPDRIWGGCAWWSEDFTRLGQLSGHRRCHRHLEIQVDIQVRTLLGECSHWNLTHIRGVWTLRPGFYNGFRAESIEQSGLAWGAILEKYLFGNYLRRYNVQIFRKKCKECFGPFFPGSLQQIWGQIPSIPYFMKMFM